MRNKKLLGLILALVFCILAIPMAGFAMDPDEGQSETQAVNQTAEEPAVDALEAQTNDAVQPTEGWTAIGTCEWRLTGEENAKTLTIRPIQNGTSGQLSVPLAWPWSGTEVAETITNVVIQSGVKAGNSISEMFKGCKNLVSVDLSGLDTSGVGSMGGMFQDCTALSTLDLSGLDTSGVASMHAMFSNCTSLSNLDLSGLNTSGLTDPDAMFEGCSNLKTLDLSSFTTTEAETMNGMFAGCVNLKTILVGDGWDTGKVDMSNGMFQGCTSLVGGAGTKCPYNNKVDKTYAKIDGGTGNEGYLTCLEKLTIVLKDGKAYADDASKNIDITEAVASKGLKFVPEVPESEGQEAVPAHWEMKNFNFTTSAITAVQFADEGNVKINVTGTNVIKSGNSSKDGVFIYAIYTGEGTSLEFCGDGTLDVTSGGSGEDVEEQVISTIGIYASSNLTFSGPTVNVTTSDIADGYSYAIMSENGIKVSAGKVEAKTGNATVPFAVCTLSQPDAKAVDSEGMVLNKWGSYSGFPTYLNGDDDPVPDVTLTAKTDISVGTQSTTLTYGTAGNPTYGVTYTGFTATDHSVTWTAGSAPAGVNTAFSGTNNETLTISTTAATPAGEYKFKVTAKNSGADVTSAEATLKVDKATPAASDFTYTAPSSLTYDGKSKTAQIISSKTGMGTVTVKYYQDDQEVAAENVKNAGEFVVKIDVADDGTNYTTATDITGNAWTFTIDQKQLTISGTTIADKVYDGTTNASITPGTLVGVCTGDDVQFTASGEFDDKNIQLNKSTTVYYEFSGEQCDNYIKPGYDIISADITAKELTVSGTTVKDKVYDGKTDAEIDTKGTLNDVCVGDDAAIDTATGTFDNKDVGTGRDVTVAYTLEGADKANYTVADTTHTANITQRGVTVSGTTINDKEYDGTTDATVKTLGTLQNLVSGEDVTVSVTSAAFEDKNVDTDKDVKVVYALIGAEAVLKNYSFTNQVTLTDAAKITQKQLTISGTKANSRPYNSTEEATINLDTVSGIVDGEESEVSVKATGVFTDANAGENKTVNVNYSLEGTGAGNYIAPEAEECTATIYPFLLTVVNSAVADKVYDGTTGAEITALGTIYPEEPFIAEDDVAIDTSTAVFDQADAKEDIGVMISYTLKGADKDNYEIGDSRVYANITPKPLTNATVTLKGDVLVATGEKLTQEVESVVLPNWTLTLIEGTDYTISGNVQTEAGNYKLKVTGTGNYTGEVEVPYTILAAPQPEEKVVITKDQPVVVKPYGENGGTVTLMETGSGASATGIVMDANALVAAAASADDLQRVANKEDLSIWINVEKQDKASSEAAIKAINEAAAGKTVGYVLNIELFKQFEDEEATPINETNNDTLITLSTVVPEDVCAANENFGVIRYHEEEVEEEEEEAVVTAAEEKEKEVIGKAEVLESTYDDSTAVLSFASSRFSDYAVTMTAKPNAPATGTETSSMIPAVLALIACAGALAVVMKKRNNA